MFVLPCTNQKKNENEEYKTKWPNTQNQIYVCKYIHEIQQQLNVSMMSSRHSKSLYGVYKM